MPSENTGQNFTSTRQNSDMVGQSTSGGGSVLVLPPTGKHYTNSYSGRNNC